MLFNIKCFIFSILFFQYNTNIIVLPFRESIPKLIQENDYLTYHFYSKELYTEISIGDPIQSLNFNINTESFIFYLQPNICYKNSPSYYNHSKSKTFKLVTFGFEEEDFYDELGEGVFASDIFTFYNSTDLNSNVTQNAFEFFFSSYLSYRKFENFCGILGFGLKQRYTDYNLDTFLNSLKRQGLINDYSWSYIYFEKENNKIINLPKITNKYIIDNFDGLLILGNYTYDYMLKSNEFNNYIQISAAEKEKHIKWALIFHKIYCKYNKEEISITNDFYADLSINYDYIISTKDYFEKIISPFFNPYLENNICKTNEIKKNGFMYEVIYCDQNLFTNNDIKKFPNIYLYHYGFNFTFELKHNELFKEMNNNIFFLILKNIGRFNEDIWKLGKIFLKKYHFSFNQDSKSIKFYYNMKLNEQYQNNNNKNKKINFNINFIWMIVCLICLIIGIYIGSRIIVKNRKMRANELLDEYEYKAENDKNKNNKFLGEKNIEMGTKGLGF